jgi:DNA polymerase-3 subunit epsilon
MIVVDVETTGVDSKINSIVSIGAVDFSNPSNTFYQENRIWFGAEVNPKALEINGFTEEQLIDRSKKTLKETVSDFIEWSKSVEDITLAGENVGRFDALFLKNSADRYGIEFPFGVSSVDLHALSYSHHLKYGIKIPLNKNRTDISSDTTLVYVGLPTEPKPHNALTGAKMEAEAFSRLIYGRCLFEEFRSYEIPKFLKD